MELKEIALKNPKEVRNNETLMRSYIDGYKSVFGYEPNCAGCTFNSDFKKFQNKVLNEPNINLKSNTMATEKNFRLKRQFLNEILWYRDGKKVIRRYGRHFDNDFVEQYLSKGKKAEIKEREAKFEVLPKAKTEAKSDEKKADDTKDVETKKVEEKAEKALKTEAKAVKEDKLPRKKSGRKPSKKK